MISLVASFAGTKVGRWIVSGLLMSAIVAYVVWSIFQKGKSSADTARKIERLEALRDKVKTDEDIRSMPADKRREHLRKWVRD